jgi:hypothetical protein
LGSDGERREGDGAGIEVESAASVRRRLGLLSGYFFLGAMLLWPPSLLVVRSYTDASQANIELGVFVLTAVGVGVGVFLILAPWERLSDRWLHLGPTVAVPQILIGNLITDGHAQFFYLLVVGYTALVFTRRRVVSAYVAAVIVAMFLPVVLAPQDNAVTLGQGIVAAPTVAALAAMIFALRGLIVRSQHAYHELAWRTAETSGRMLRHEDERNALDALAQELRARDRESMESPIALEPRRTRRFAPAEVARAVGGKTGEAEPVEDSSP